MLFWKKPIYLVKIDSSMSKSFISEGPKAVVQNDCNTACIARHGATIEALEILIVYGPGA
jgi:hypothetical protein